MKLIFCFLCFIVSCGKTPSVSLCDPTPPLTQNLYVYGDSITLANGSWPELLANDQGYTLIQKSVGSTHILSATQAPALLTDIFVSGSILVYAPGINDAFIFGASPEHMAAFRANLTAIVSRMNSIGVKAYIGTPNRVNGGTFISLHNFVINEYAAITREVLSQQSTACLVDFNTCFVPTKNNTAPDGIHPNASGYSEMYECFKKGQS